MAVTISAAMKLGLDWIFLANLIFGMVQFYWLVVDESYFETTEPKTYSYLISLTGSYSSDSSSEANVSLFLSGARAFSSLKLSGVYSSVNFLKFPEGF